MSVKAGTFTAVGGQEHSLQYIFVDMVSEVQVVTGLVDDDA